MKIEIWSDVACPWCYIGKRRFETALAAFPHRDSVEVQWRSYQLDPTLPEHYDGTELDYLSTRKGMAPAQVTGDVRACGRPGQRRGAQLPLRRRRGGQQLHRPPADPPRRRAREAGRGQGTPAQRPLRARQGHRQPGLPHLPRPGPRARRRRQSANCSAPTNTPTPSGRTSRRPAPWASTASPSSSSTGSTGSPEPSPPGRSARPSNRRGRKAIRWSWSTRPAAAGPPAKRADRTAAPSSRTNPAVGDRSR